MSVGEFVSDAWHRFHGEQILTDDSTRKLNIRQPQACTSCRNRLIVVSASVSSLLHWVVRVLMTDNDSSVNR